MRAPILIGETHLWGKGLGTDLLRTILEYVFMTLNHRTFYALDIDSSNLRALKLYTRCGFIPYEIIRKDNKMNKLSYFTLSMKITRERYSAICDYLFNLPY